MALVDPPEILVGGSWHQTEWDPAAMPAMIDRGERSMGPRDVRYWRWVVHVQGEPKRVFRLRTAGPDAPNPLGAVVLVLGRNSCLGRIDLTDGAGDGEYVEFDASSINVRAQT